MNDTNVKIMQFLRQQQVTYSNIFQYPVLVFRNLLFDGGNGYRCENGILCKRVGLSCRASENDTLIPVLETITDIRSNEEEIEFYKNNVLPHQINDNMESTIYWYERSKSLPLGQSKELSQEDLFNIEFEKYAARLTDLCFVKNEHDLISWKFYAKQLLEMFNNEGYIIQIRFSASSSLVTQFNECTEKEMIEISIAVCRAFIFLYTLFIKSKLKDAKTSYAIAMAHLTPISIGEINTIKQDLAHLKVIIKQLKALR